MEFLLTMIAESKEQNYVEVSNIAQPDDET
jgi:hypothetical protein